MCRPTKRKQKMMTIPVTVKEALNPYVIDHSSTGPYEGPFVDVSGIYQAMDLIGEYDTVFNRNRLQHSMHLDVYFYVHGNKLNYSFYVSGFDLEDTQALNPSAEDYWYRIAPQEITVENFGCHIVDFEKFTQIIATRPWRLKELTYYLGLITDQMYYGNTNKTGDLMNTDYVNKLLLAKKKLESVEQDFI